MRAIILAAGMGKRFGSITKTIPKALLDIGGISIIEKQLKILHSLNISEITIVSGHKANLLRKKLMDYGVEFVHNESYHETETLYSLWCARNSLQTDCLCLYSDLVFEKEIISTLLDDTNDICLIIGKLQNYIDSHTVFVKNNLIKDIGKSLSKQHANNQYIGIAKFSQKGAQIINHLLNEFSANNDLNGEVTRIFEKLLELKIPIHSCNIQNLKWLNINDYSQLSGAKTQFNK